MSFKESFKAFMRINQVGFIIFSNYLFYVFIYNMINDYLFKTLSYEFATNLINLYVSIYILTITFFLKKFVIKYAEFLIKLNQRNTYAIINMMRFVLCLFVSIPASNLLKLNVEEWGGWLLLMSYCNFLLGFYFRVDLLDILIKKVKLCFKIKEKIEEINIGDVKNKAYIEKLFSGCMLDLQIICCFRLIILYFTKRWLGAFLKGDYYINCKFQINDKFFYINIWGLSAIVTVNIVLAIFIFYYMNKSKNLLLLYKIKHNFFYNVFFLFVTHSYFEGNLNMFYSYFPSH